MQTSNEKSNNLPKVKSFLFKGLTVASVALLGLGMYESVTMVVRGESGYENYTVNCQVFLGRAGSAGTIGIAQGELARALRWLEVNYPQSSFEYRDLKANLVYLQNQQPSSVVPASIKDSIRKNAELINGTEEQKLSKSYFGIKLIILLPVVLGTLFILGCMFASTAVFDKD